MWPFKRKPAPPAPINPGPINEDWKAGDLAECVGPLPWRDGFSGEETIGPEIGDTSRVISILAARTPAHGDCWYLEINGWSPGAYYANSFRKVPELNAAADAEFTALIKPKRPVPLPCDSDASLAEDPKGLSGEAVAARAEGIAQ